MYFEAHECDFLSNLLDNETSGIQKEFFLKTCSSNVLYLVKIENCTSILTKEASVTSQIGEEGAIYV